MIAHLRDAEDDAKRENFNDSRVKIEAVRSFINKKDSGIISSNRQDLRKESAYRRSSNHNDSARSLISGESVKKNKVAADSREEEENRLIAEQISRSTRRLPLSAEFGQSNHTQQPKAAPSSSA